MELPKKKLNGVAAAVVGQMQAVDLRAMAANLDDFRDRTTLRAKALHRLAELIQADLDMAIFVAVAKELGREPVEADMAGGQLTFAGEGGWVTYSYRGVPIVRKGPVELQDVPGPDGKRDLRGSQPLQILNGAKMPEPPKEE